MRAGAGVSVLFHAQRISSTPVIWGRMMRAVGDVFRSQRIELNSTSWKRAMREVAGFFSEVVVLIFLPTGNGDHTPGQAKP